MDIGHARHDDSVAFVARLRRRTPARSAMRPPSHRGHPRILGPSAAECQQPVPPNIAIMLPQIACIRFIMSIHIHRRWEGKFQWRSTGKRAKSGSGAMRGLRRSIASLPGLGEIERRRYRCARMAGSSLPVQSLIYLPSSACRSRGLRRPLDHARARSIAIRISSMRGNRAHEFEMRLEGATYEEVARAGGGIVSSVKATSAGIEADLVRKTLPRLDTLMAEGVTTVEVKSGYGLDLENELKIAQGGARARRYAARYRPHHAFSAPMRCRLKHNGDKAAYIAKVVTKCCPPWCAHAGSCRCGRWLLRRHRLFAGADRPRLRCAPGRSACRSSCTPTNSPISVARQLAASYGALSADHLEYHERRRCRRHGEIRHRRGACCPAPTTSSARRRSRRSTAFRNHGVPMAIATDNNPGTSPLTSLLLTMNMAATFFRMTVEECLAGVTRKAAKRSRASGRNRHDRGRQMGRPRHLGHRSAGRTRLPHRLQSAVEARVVQRNDRKDQDDHHPPSRLRYARHNSRRSTGTAKRPASTPSFDAAIQKSAARIAEIASGTEPVYGINTGFGKLASIKIDRRGYGDPAAQPDPVALLRPRRAARPRSSCG